MVLSSLMQLYAKQVIIANAFKVFDLMFERDVSWSTMMEGYAWQVHAKESFEMNALTFLSAIRACNCDVG
jgi:hypothetical protein